MKFNQIFAACLALGFAWAIHAEPPELKSADLPRIPPIEPAESLRQIQIKQGFRVELVAAEPLVSSPIAISFDENGRMFVVEMRDYSERRDAKPHLGRIRMLEDTNWDGVFDTATVYLDDLPWPTGVACYDGGLFVAASPDILFCKDTDGDGKADERKVVFTGFGAGKGDKLNVQALLNSLTWGPDNRIHGVAASSGGRATSSERTNALPLDLGGRDFLFDPRTLELQAEAGGGQYGMCFDDHGRRFTCSNSHHIQIYMYDLRYAERNPFYNMPSPLVDIPVDGPAAEVFRISPEEGWRVIRTRWRVSGAVPGLIEGGGRASGYFTSATGITIYRGDALPPENIGDAFTADCGSNLIHRKRIRHDGVALIAERPPDEKNVEFLASTDLWFRPVQMANGPDGALYIVDMYREVIEHPWSLPENLKKHLDLNSGCDRGRIYRVVPAGFQQPPRPTLGQATTPELVATLGHRSGWHRDTAARLLYERQDKVAVPLLEQVLKKSTNALARLHALHALEGGLGLKETQLLVALDDNDPSLREHAVQLSEKFTRTGSLKLWSKLRQLRNDPDANVRFQLALTLGEFNRPGMIEGLVSIAERDFESAWTRAAILSSLSEGAGEVFSTLAGDPRIHESKSGQEFLRQLLILVGAQDKPGEIELTLKHLSKTDDIGMRLTFLLALNDGLERGGSSLNKISGMGKIEPQARSIAQDDQLPESLRVLAIQFLGLSGFRDSGQTLLSLLELKQPQSVQLAAVSALGRFNDLQVGPELTTRFPVLTPQVRAAALAVLLARPDRAAALLAAIEAGGIRPVGLDSTQQKFLREHKDKEIRQLANNLLGAKPAGTRQQVIEEFTPALTLKGNAEHGKKLCAERCVSCHRLDGGGFQLGPDLVTVKNFGREKLLTAILDPNREVRPEFTSYLIETKDEQSLIGLVMSESVSSVTLHQAYGREDVIRRANITKMQSQGRSLMPEGLEAALSPQDMADLLEYLEAAGGME